MQSKIRSYDDDKNDVEFSLRLTLKHRHIKATSGDKRTFVPFIFSQILRN